MGFIGFYFVMSNPFPAFLCIALASVVYMLYLASPQVAVMTTAVTTISYIFYAKWAFTEWEKYFAGERLRRNKKCSPSFQRLPSIKRSVYFCGCSTAIMATC